MERKTILRGVPKLARERETAGLWACRWEFWYVPDYLIAWTLAASRLL